jgi:arylsulfatase A-like enzyme
MSSPPNILLFVFDTLRPDFLSCYTDGSPIQTPNIDQVATEGTLFKNAFSAGPGTDISHSALFTGQFPSETGLIGGGKTIPKTLHFLPEQFSRAGYETFGISGPGKIRSDLGFDRGFDEYLEPYYDDLEPSFSPNYIRSVVFDSLVARDFIRTLWSGQDSLTSLKFDLLERELKRAEDPVFAFVNFLTVHAPYDPPRPYKQRATPSLSRSRFYALDLLKSIIGFGGETIEEPDVRSDRVLRAANCLGQPFHADPNWLTDRELETVRKWYAASVSYLDDQFGQFLSFLERTEMDENTIVVVCSDHGEHLGEHGLLYHADFLYDEVIQVPLILRGPGVPTALQREDLASLVDIFDTLCTLSSIESPDSTSSQSLFDGKERDAVFAEYGIRDMSKSTKQSDLTEDKLVPYRRGLKCIRTPEHKLVIRSDDVTELYELPNEENRIEDTDVESELLKRLSETIGTKFRHFSDPLQSDTDDRIRENLEELGYI